MNTRQYPWALVIFACRESLPQLLQTLDAAQVSAASCAVIDVLVNGNPPLASALATELTRRQAASAGLVANPAIRIWTIALGDKANAWNQYIHHIWATEELAFFIDGYVRLNPDAVALLGQAVVANTQALSGTGVPTMGRSAKALREDLITNTGFHGNFCCIKGQTIRQMRDQSIRLPVGLYRTDSLMGAILSYALDPGNHVWEDHRIHVHPDASWQIDPAKWWRAKDLLAYAKRFLRQHRGKLENAAFADHLVHRLCSPAKLPATAHAMVLEWVDRCPDDYAHLAKSHFFIRHVLKSFQSGQLDATMGLEPHLVWQREPNQHT